VTTTPAADDRGRPDRAGLAVAAFLLILAGSVAWDAATISSGVASYSRIGPEVFPFGIATGLAVLAVFTAVSAVMSGRPERQAIEPAPILWVVGGLALQIALLPFTGFSIATGAVFAGTARAFGRKRLWLTYPIGAVLALAIWVAFAAGLKLVLPAGPIERAALVAVTRVAGFLADNAAAVADFVRDLLSTLF
jgi:putative tricarboxylic transport membrane protein